LIVGAFVLVLAVPNTWHKIGPLQRHFGQSGDNKVP
jgi:hypothetical protein